MGVGGLIAGLAVAVTSGLVTRGTTLREDASFAGSYLASLSLGVLIVSTHGSNIDLLHVLFGSILAIDANALQLMGAIATVSALTLSIIYRPLIMESFDPGFLRAVGGRGSVYHLLFLVLVVLNLVAGFEALGTLMAVGLMMLPAIAARFWARSVPGMMGAAALFALAAGLIGLIASYRPAPSTSCRSYWDRRAPSCANSRCAHPHDLTYRNRHLIRLLAILLAVLFSSAPGVAKTVQAVASFTVLADMVHEVGGTRVAVVSLVGPDGDPHVFEPAPEAARRLREADIVITSGLGLEGWMDRLIRASGYRGMVVVASNGITTRSMSENGRQIIDPHAWNSLPNGLAYVANIVRALTAVDPEGAAIYSANGRRYSDELLELDGYTRQQIATVPTNRRAVLTSHDALGYFGDAYGVRFLSPVGVSTESEASAATIAHLINQIKSEHIRAYFFENSNDPKLIRQIAAATSAQSGGELYVESLSPPNGPAPTYAAMFRHNVDLMVSAMLLN
jgi:ABC-type Zn uptake system ZnuABC Zn-binding protein ZnuA